MLFFAVVFFAGVFFAVDEVVFFLVMIVCGPQKKSERVTIRRKLEIAIALVNCLLAKNSVFLRFFHFWKSDNSGREPPRRVQ